MEVLEITTLRRPPGQCVLLQTGFCEYGNESSVSIKAWRFLTGWGFVKKFFVDELYTCDPFQLGSMYINDFRIYGRLYGVGTRLLQGLYLHRNTEKVAGVWQELAIAECERSVTVVGYLLALNRNAQNSDAFCWLRWCKTYFVTLNEEFVCEKHFWEECLNLREMA